MIIPNRSQKFCPAFKWDRLVIWLTLGSLVRTKETIVKYHSFAQNSILTSCDNWATLIHLCWCRYCKLKPYFEPALCAHTGKNLSRRSTVTITTFMRRSSKRCSSPIESRQHWETTSMKVSGPWTTAAYYVEAVAEDSGQDPRRGCWSKPSPCATTPSRPIVEIRLGVSCDFATLE